MNEHPLAEAARRATSFRNEGRLFEAEALFRQLVQAEPDYPMAHYVYGNLKLLLGDYEAAWPLFQRRLDDEFYRRKGTMNLPQPFWDGGEQPDRTLLVHIDQGIGDAILCARYMPAVAEKVGQAIFAVHAGMGRFFSSVDPRIRIAEVGDPVPEFDLHIDAFSLPVLFDAAPGNIPEPPYLSAEPELAAKWRQRLGGSGLAVGVAWQGNPDHARDEERSMKISDLLPMLQVPGVRFYGLQVGPGAEQAADLPSAVAFESLEQELSEAADNMVDTAAAVANLDLVVSVDSAVAHLAAAMGRPTWVPTYMVPDWRWLMITGTEPLRYRNAPWYPAARVFPAKQRYDWTAPVAEMAELLAAASASATPA